MIATRWAIPLLWRAHRFGSGSNTWPIRDRACPASVAPVEVQIDPSPRKAGTLRVIVNVRTTDVRAGDLNLVAKFVRKVVIDRHTPVSIRMFWINGTGGVGADVALPYTTLDCTGLHDGR